MSNLFVPMRNNMTSKDLKFDIRVLSHIENFSKALKSVRYPSKNCHGPFTIFLGMSAFVEGSKNLQYILNRLRMDALHDAVDQISTRLWNEVRSRACGAMNCLSSNYLIVFAIDNLDQKNLHRLTLLVPLSKWKGETRYKNNRDSRCSNECIVSN